MNEVERLLDETQILMAQWRDALRHHLHPDFQASRVVQKTIENRLAAISKELCEVLNVSI
ncbi:hypothetical protein F9K97_24810 [Brucella anthropi]|jgi:hypothetical protein|uniref:hypothetical protein n=1 Tax=Brucella anthropi TaxID=529 RepID=UPI00124F566B|nr:hypothetical protein [Brucella anthropi]KAB2774648.1 hypothetical protein F9K97_24810 [Brucella anthropi]